MAAEDVLGATALVHAVAAGHAACSRALLDAGATFAHALFRGPRGAPPAAALETDAALAAWAGNAVAYHELAVEAAQRRSG